MLTPQKKKRPKRLDGPLGGYCSTGYGEPVIGAHPAGDIIPVSGYDFPTPETIAQYPPPRRFSEFSNEQLAVMASQGVTGAFKERLLREIMRADGCSYSQAYRVLGMMNTTNESLQNYYKLPYLIGIGTAVSGGILSIPVVFHQGTAVWFCETFVLEEVPDLAELDTFWKVGAWTWTWMEPAIGTASFVLLSMQLIRSQMKKIQMKPYIGRVMTWKADALCEGFPQYEREIVRDYAKADLWGLESNRARGGYPANSVFPIDR